MSGGLKIYCDTECNYERDILRHIFSQEINNRQNMNYAILEDLILGKDGCSYKPCDNHVLPLEFIAKPHIGKMIEIPTPDNRYKDQMKRFGAYDDNSDSQDIFIELRPKNGRIVPEGFIHDVSYHLKNHKSMLIEFPLEHTFGVGYIAKIQIFYDQAQKPEQKIEAKEASVQEIEKKIIAA